jgi:transposase
MKNNKKKFIGKAFVGIDVHKNNWKVCVLGDHGYRKEFSCDPIPSVLRSALVKLLPDFEFQCAYEAGFCGFWIHDALNIMEGFNCIVVNAADIPTSDKERAQKEDRRDARKIATHLKAEVLKGIYVLSKEAVALRELQRLHFTVTKDLTKCKNRIKSFLFRHGIEICKEQFKKPSSHWSNKFIQWLQRLELDPLLRITLDEMLENVIRLRNQKKRLLVTIRKEIKSNKELEAQYVKLIGIHGIGLISSITILSEVEDIRRFSTYEKFHSFVGLIPSTNSSADIEKIRGITNRANKRLRSILVEVAWITLRKDADLLHYYMELKQRMSSNKAIIRIAKKVATKVRYELLNGEELEKIAA